MRADRLVAVLLLMQARGRVTAAEVAGELEISVATARRDLEALSAAGVPVYPQAGRGGGWSLVGGARTDLTGLTASEAQALFLLAGPAASIAPAVRSALRKLVQALPGTFRADAEAAASAVMIDSARWGEPGRPRPEVVDTLQDAVVRRRKVRFWYKQRERRVSPLGLVDKDGIWYLLAETPDGQRTFRVERMGGTKVTDEPAERPAGFDLPTAWEQVVDTVEQRRSLLSARVLIEPRYLMVLMDHFGRHCRVEGDYDRERVSVRVAAPTPLMIAQQLAGWGALVEVLDPPSVQAELARLGRELVQRYA
jgi:predicted DNA-binding transcriptional regulator YafY